MLPTDGLISEQQLQMKMMMANPKHVECLTDGEFTTPDEVFNMIEVLSDEVTLSALFQYHPQTKTYVSEPVMFTLSKDTHFGYFKNMAITEGRVRIAIW